MNKNSNIIFYTALLIVFLDQFTKFLVKKLMQPTQSIPVIKNAFHFTYITNTGSAFGLFKGFNWLFILISIIVIAVILYNLNSIKKESKKFQFAVGLLFGGTIGNLFDRIFYGGVIDFIDFRIWPVFNVADSAVTISVILLIVLLWKE